LSELSGLINLVLIFAVAAAGGMLALWLKQPVIIGYLIGGIIVGPFTIGPQVDFAEFKLFTDIGLALLLFVLGAKMTPSQFRGLGKVIVFGGLIQIALTIGLGLLFSLWFGLNLIQGLFLGLILSQSSTAVIAKVLDDRDETDSVHGRISVGVCAVQDLISLPLLVLILMFLGQNNATPVSTIINVAYVIGLVALVYVFGKFLLPFILNWLRRFASDELILLVVLVVALGAGFLLEKVGLSIALGSFLAGLLIAGSPHRPAAISRLLPLRDIFAAVFFVSIGALFNPSVILESIIPLVALLCILLIGKGFIGTVVTRCFGQSHATATMTGLLLAQIGEFAFISAIIALERGVFSQQFFSLIMAAAIISIFVNALALDSAPSILSRLAKLVGFRPLLKGPTASLRSVSRRPSRVTVVKPYPPPGKKQDTDQDIENK
jgi:CPA2 family monovalent cation:H+ antiporter-2